MLSAMEDTLQVSIGSRCGKKNLTNPCPSL